MQNLENRTVLTVMHFNHGKKLKEFTLHTVDWEVEEILDYLKREHGIQPSFTPGFFFVKTEKGEITEVWAGEGNVPTMDKNVRMLYKETI